MKRTTAPLLLAALLAAPMFATETVRIKGSDTIGGALAPDLGASFRKHHPDVTVTVEALGSGTAFVGLFDGSADLGASSRPATAKELEQATALGIRLGEWVLGYDGVAVIVHPANPVTSLTVSEISDLFTGKVQRWNAVGGDNLAVRRISRPSYSGTYGFFKEKALRRGDPKGPEEFASDTQVMEDNHDIIAEVAKDRGAIAYVGLGWVDARVKALAISRSAGQPAAIPSLETIRNGSYPLYRPLLFYTRGEPTGATRRFLRFALSQEGRAIVSKHGFVPPDTLQELHEKPAQPAQQGAAATASLYRIYFASGSSSLSQEARDTLRQIAERVRQGGVRALVVGHSDARGSTAAKEAVARARARAAALYLRELGVAPDALSVSHASAEEPIATNETAAGRASNRRVDVKLVPLPGR